MIHWFLSSTGEYCIHIAAQNHNIDILRLLAACHGIDMNAREACGGYTALHQACETGDAAVRQFLLAQCRHQLQLETPSYGRLTAYQFAAAAGDVDAMEALRDCGAVELPAPEEYSSSEEEEEDSDGDSDMSDDELQAASYAHQCGTIMAVQ